MQGSTQFALLPLLLLLLLSLTHPSTCQQQHQLNITLEAPSVPGQDERSGIIFNTESTIIVNVSVTGTAPAGSMTFSVVDERIFELGDLRSLRWHGNDTSDDHQIELVGIALGWTQLRAVFIADSNSTSAVELSDSEWRVTVLRQQTVVQTIYRYVIIVMVVFVVFGMGSTIDINIVIGHLRRPIALIIGWSLQFVLMPHLALAIGQMLTSLLPNLSNVKSFAFGLLTVGCSPGGGGSNAWTLLFGGDLDLSITMTFFSQICAMFMMPLWLFLYSGLYIDTDEVSIPYLSVVTNLLQLVIPVILGVALRWKFPKLAAIATKAVKPFTLLFVIFIIGFGFYANFFLFQLIGRSPIIIPFAALLPWFGYLLAYVIALLCRLKRSQAVAVALECGIQNVGIPILILQFSMPRPDGQLAAVVPLIVVLLTPTPLYVLLLIKRVREFLKRRSGDYEAEDGAEKQTEEVENAKDDNGLSPSEAQGEKPVNNFENKGFDGSINAIN